MLIEINPYNIDDRLIKQIIEILKNDGIIVCPTDTVYALVCRLHSKNGLEKLARYKGLKLNKTNFSVIFNDLSHLSDYVKAIDRPTFKLLNRNLPGPFTFILTANNAVPKLFDSNKKEIGIRIPDNEIIREIVRQLNEPLASTSLHDSEDELLDYFTDPYQIYERFDDKVDMIIDGGQGNLYASTVVDCSTSEISILRQGIGELLL
jgi:tRNA threonylcarbamoyl adenosine modification protein (Sua5/YciO/YrdC/YwlC family)